MTTKKLNKLFAKQPEVIYELMYGAMADVKYKDAFEKKKSDFEGRINSLLSDSEARIPTKNIYEIEAKKGCLSLLGGPRTCKRYKTIKVQFQTLEMKTHVKNYTGWTAQIIQHEIDHCNGILI